MTEIICIINEEQANKFVDLLGIASTIKMRYEAGLTNTSHFTAHTKHPVLGIWWIPIQHLAVGLGDYKEQVDNFLNKSGDSGMFSVLDSTKFYKTTLSDSELSDYFPSVQ